MTRFKSRALAIVGALVTCCSTSYAQDNIAIVVSDNDDLTVGVVSRVLTGTAGLAPEATTDPTGRARLLRACKPGELVQAVPIEEVVYEPSAEVNCSSELQIKVRRRPFAESGVILFSIQEVEAMGSAPKLAVTKVALKSAAVTVNDPAHPAGCKVVFEPLTITTIYEMQGQKVATVTDDKAWSQLPREVGLSNSCPQSEQDITAAFVKYANDMKLEIERSGTEKWIAANTKAGDYGSYEPLKDSDWVVNTEQVPEQ